MNNAITAEEIKSVVSDFSVIPLVNFDEASLLGLSIEEKRAIYKKIERGEDFEVAGYKFCCNHGHRNTYYDDGVVSQDNYPGTYFPNNTYQYGVLRLPAFEIRKNLTHSVETTRMNPVAAECTRLLRKRIVQNRLEYANPTFKRFHRDELVSKKNQIMLPLFPGKKIRADYLTMNNPMWRRIILRVYHAAVKIYGEENKHALSQMITSWNICFPHSVEVLRNENDRMKSAEPFCVEGVKLIRNWFLFSMVRPLYEADDEYLREAAPRYKAGKALGPFGEMPDGSLITESSGFYPKVWQQLDGANFTKEAKVNIAFKSNSLLIRLAWIKSERMIENYEWLINDAKMDQPEDVMKAFEKRMIGAGFCLRRDNNTDPNLGVEAGEEGHSKDRRFSYEVLAPTGINALVDNVKFNQWVRKNVIPTLTEVTEDIKYFCTKKSRVAYSFDNACKGVPGIFLARISLKQYEDSIVGFPSTRPKMTAAYQAFYDKTQGMWTLMLKGDNVNSEQTMTVMYRAFQRILEDSPYYSLWRNLSASVTPSEGGIIFDDWVCMSGWEFTTMNNLWFGFFRTLTVLTYLVFGLHPRQQDVAQMFALGFKCFHEKRAWFVVKSKGLIYIPLKASLDDTIQILKGTNSEDERQIRENFKLLQSYCEETRFSLEVDTTAKPTYGCAFFETKPPETDAKLSVAKWYPGANEPQKEPIGDFQCFKLFTHLVMMDPRMAEAIRQICLDEGAGDIFLCEIFAIAAMHDHVLMKHSISSIYEQGSITSEIMYSKGLSDVLLKEDQHYKLEDLKPYLEIFRRHFRSFYNTMSTRIDSEMQSVLEKLDQEAVRESAQAPDDSSFAA